MEKQVDKSAYDFDKYSTIERYASYWYQAKSIIDAAPSNMLEVGGGDGFLENFVKTQTKTEYKNIDIAEDLEPDILGDVKNMPLEDNSFDLVCAFEVLEHIPYEDFVPALKEIARVAKKDVIISLPHWGRHFAIHIRMPFIKNIRWQKKFTFRPQEHKFNGEHYWEIGKKGYPLSRIKSDMQKAGLKIVNDKILFESPYHHLFILKVGE